MRVAIAGKGGAGKTTISATLSRLEASRGVPVIAIDADSNPNLASALGISLAANYKVGLPFDLVSRKQVGLALTKSLEDVLSQFSTCGPDGLRLILMGSPAHADEGCLCASHWVVSALLSDLSQYRHWAVILDLEASPEHLSRGTVRYVDVLVLVAEPYYRSLETVRRMAELASELEIPEVRVIFNKVRNIDDSSAMNEFCSSHGLKTIGEIRWSNEVGEADRAGAALFDRLPSGAVVADIDAIALNLRQITGSYL